MAKRFDVLAASHGAAGVGLIVIFGEAGIATLFGLDRFGIGICFLILSFSYAMAMLFFGFRTRVDDARTRQSGSPEAKPDHPESD